MSEQMVGLLPTNDAHVFVDPNDRLPHIIEHISMVQKCRQEKNIACAHHVHLKICQHGLQTHKEVGNFVVPMFVDCGSIEKALQVFRQLSHYNEHSWTSLIQGLNDCKEWQQAVDVYQKMLEFGVLPTKFTFAALLKASTGLKHVSMGQEVHMELTKKGLEGDPSLGNTLVDMYAKYDMLADAESVFDCMENPDVFSWTALAAGYLDLGFPNEALVCLDNMKEAEIIPTAITYLCGIRACCMVGNREKGYLLHLEIAIDGFEMVSVLGSALVLMYVTMNLLEEAQDVFDELVYKDIKLWNSLLVGYAKQGYGEMALNFWDRMQMEGIPPDATTFVGTLRACATVAEIKRGQLMHAECCFKGFETDLFVSSNLLEMYIEFGQLAEAQRVFDGLPVRDVVLWTGLISGYSENGLTQEAFNYLDLMLKDGISPNSVTYVCILKACSNVEDREKGENVHAEIVKLGFERDKVIWGSLVELYAKWGLLEEAQFLTKGHNDIISLNSLIAGYVKHEMYEEAVEWIKNIHFMGVFPTVSTYLSALKSCGALQDLNAGREVHINIVKHGMETEKAIGNSVIDMYIKCHSLTEAENIFHNLSERDTISWTALIQGYSGSGLGTDTLACLEDMQLEGVYADIFTLVCGLQASTSIRALDRGQEVHTKIVKQGLDGHQMAGTTLVDMYVKFGLLEEALSVFGAVVNRDVVLWNALIQGYAIEGLLEEAALCLQEMQEEGIIPDEISWGHLLSSYVEQEETENALEVYTQMLSQGILPNNEIFVALLELCGNTAAFESGRKLHSQIHKPYMVEVTELNLATTLIDMYGKCGSMENAQQVFDAMDERDVVAWNALLSGYAREGRSELVYYLCEKMEEEGLEPNEVTCLCLLSACRHSGLVIEGQRYFESMGKEFGVIPTMKHYTCAIDLLGRAGCLDEIVPLMENMPLEPNIVTWHTIMSACRKYGNLELVRQAFLCATRLGEKQAGAYISMSNIYSDTMSEWSIDFT